MGRPSSTTVLELVGTVLALALAGCCGEKRERATEILDSVQDERLVFGFDCSSLAVYRQTVADLKETRELVSLGECGAEVCTQRLQRGPAQVSEGTASLCAYAIEKTGYARGLEPLRGYLLASPGRAGQIFAPFFAVRALLVLRGIPDATEGRVVYDDATVRRALDGP